MRASSCKTVLLTGASTGLGLAIAHALLDTGHRLILTCREHALPRFAGAGIRASDRVWLRALDVTSREERMALIGEAEERWGGVDVLINNAGVAYRSVLEHVTEAELLAQMSVNFLAPLELARLVLPGMRQRRTGHIINISSVGGMMAMPTMAIYSASKFALEGAFEALFYEVRPWGIAVSLVQPGFIHSSSFRNVVLTELGSQAQRHPTDAYHAHYAHMAPFIARLMDRARATPERVADRVVKLIDARRPPLRVPATVDAHLFSLLRRLLPRRTYHWVLFRCLPSVRSWGRALPLAPAPVAGALLTGAAGGRERGARATDPPRAAHGPPGGAPGGP
jgi:hypothetical protein